MHNLISTEKISLKNNPNITEDMLQAFIFENPSVLGLGDLTPIRREKTQPSGGRLDMLLADDSTHYEVEIQLGSTDPSHIIRTIEYWDSEKKRYPQYDHCAVIIAENITSRFMNVISLFNGAIPLIALQISATRLGDDVNIDFVKVLDRTTTGTEEENYVEPTDRNYWEKQSKVLSFVDIIFSDVSNFAAGLELKYNKYYIGIAQNGSVSNFISFKPKKHFVYLIIKGEENLNFRKHMDDAEVECDYIMPSKEYKIKISKTSDYEFNKEQIHEMIKAAMEFRNIDY